jgi:hypothetical protein
MTPGTGTSPTAVTVPREAEVGSVRTGATLSATRSAERLEVMKTDPVGAGEPGSRTGPVRSTTQPMRKGVRNRAPGKG